MSYFQYAGKKVFYTESGSGMPCVFLHGNTASSKMFHFILPYYEKDMRIILLDFLGNGKSERLRQFPDELWIDQGMQVIALCKALGYPKVNLVGTSGGAYAAINAALAAPALFHKVVADSFDGRRLPAGFAEALLQERQYAKADPQARGFYEWCQGEDWERVVELDTTALVNLARKGLRLFLGPIARIQTPLLITVSQADAMLANDMAAECRELHSENPNIHYRLFDRGEHPLILSRAEEMAAAIKGFFLESNMALAKMDGR